jgi:hypothetical protein
LSHAPPVEPAPQGAAGPGPAEPAGARVFVHHTAGNEADAAAARALADRLGREGFAVAAVRPVPLRIRAGSVRYYFARDGDVARALRAACNAHLTPGPRCPRGPLDFSHFSPKPAQGTVEIWLSSS